MKILTFETRVRAETKNNQGRVIQSERHFKDFIVSGSSLKKILNAEDLDLISPFGWGDETGQKEVIVGFTGDRKSVLPGNRHVLYICPECGDIACGAITMEIEIKGDKVIWKNFGYENGYESIDFYTYSTIAPIEFNKMSYLKSLTSILA